MLPCIICKFDDKEIIDCNHMRRGEAVQCDGKPNDNNLNIFWARYPFSDVLRDFQIDRAGLNRENRLPPPLQHSR